MTLSINNAQEASISISSPRAERNISITLMSPDILHNTRKKSASTPETPEWNMDSCQEETDRRALERAEDEGMI